MLRVYAASAMTGRTGRELNSQARFLKAMADQLGIELLDPIACENVPDTDEPLHNGGADLATYWKRDKEMIRRAHVLIDFTGTAKSEGVAHEIGYARYFLWRPVIRVYPFLGDSIARLEDDVIARTPVLALALAKYRWGTPLQRLGWKLRILNRCLPAYIAVRLKWLVDWI